MRKHVSYSESKLDKISILDLRENPQQNYLNSFTELYEKTFTDPLEREDPNEWQHRMQNKPIAPQPDTHLLVALSSNDLGNQSVVGGLIFEHYRTSHCGLLTYLVVEQTWRQKGIARALVNQALATLIQKECDSGGKLHAVFCETENPRFVSNEKSAMPTCERLNALLNLGARFIDLNQYIQPTLVGGKGPCEYLLLMAFNQQDGLDEIINNAPANTIARQIVYDFLYEFYMALGVDCPENDINFRKMIPYLQNDLKLHDPREKPVLSLKEVAVSLHYVQPCLEPPKQALPYPSCPVFQSMELDLMSYGYQVRKLLGSQCEYEGQIPIEIEFPDYVDYLSEGRHMLLLPVRRNCRVRVMISSTLFLISGIRVWHVVLVPDNDEIFTEFDIIKLIHLYDGRTEDTNLTNRVKFKLTPQNGKEIKVTVEGLLGAILNDRQNCPKNHRPTGGTVQIITGKSCTLSDSNTVDIMALIAEIKSIQANSSQQTYDNLAQNITNGTPQGKALLALCGVIAGIFDFAEVDTEEILDTMKPTFTSPEILIQIHRCTMVSIAEADRAMTEVINTIGISPYLLLPHSALLHNEALIEDSEATLSIATNKERMNLKGKVRTALSFLTNKGQIKLARLVPIHQRVERNLLRFYLPNVFNYTTERTLFTRGSEERGTNDRLAAIHTKFQEVDSQVKSAWELSNDYRQKIISALLSVFPIIGLRNVISDITRGTRFEPYSWWILFGLVGVMFFLYRWAVKRK